MILAINVWFFWRDEPWFHKSSPRHWRTVFFNQWVERGMRFEDHCAKTTSKGHEGKLAEFRRMIRSDPKAHKQSGRRGVPRGVQSVWRWKGETHRIDQWICDQSWRSHCSHSIWGLQDMLGFLFFSLDPLRPLPVSHSSHCSVAVSTGQPYFAAKRFCLSFCFHCSLEKITSKEWDQQFYQAPDEAKPVTVHPLYILWTKKTRYTFGHPDLLSMAVPNSAGHLKLDHQTHLNSFGLKSKVNGRMTGVT